MFLASVSIPNEMVEMYLRSGAVGGWDKFWFAVRVIFFRGEGQRERERES